METDNQVPVNKLKTSNKMPLFIGLAAIIILVGLGAGWFFASKKIATNANKANIPSITVSKNEAGVTDPSTIKDVTTATGTLKVGGIRGEGTYHLDRSGGSSQTVYLTSTTVDMSGFVNEKVQVWGQTLASQNAPWFMDVGKIKVVQ